MTKQNLFIFNFKKLLFRIIFPVFVSVVILGLIFSYFFEKYIIRGNSSSGPYKVHRIIYEEHRNEIPILGSSRAESSFVPKKLGDSYFNYGLSGIGFDVVNFFLQQELSKKKSTPVIINLDFKVVYSIGDVLYYISEVKNERVKELLGNKFDPLFIIPFIRYYGRYEHYLKDFVNQKVKLTKVFDKGGTFIKQSVSDNEFNSLVTKRKMTNNTFVANYELKSTFISLIKNTKRNIIIVVAPYHKSFFLNNDLHVFQEFLDELKTINNVIVLDYSKNNYPDNYFSNTTHLNYEGAMFFSETLKNDIEKHLR